VLAAAIPGVSSSSDAATEITVPIRIMDPAVLAGGIAPPERPIAPDIISSSRLQASRSGA
jgi:hypothetical protein